jgi:two-component system sensor histidine kinase PilS (NtrC family)
MSDPLRHPKRVTPEEEFYKKQIQWILFLRIIFLTLLLGISLLLQLNEKSLAIPPIKHITYFIAAVYLYTILSAIILRVISKYKKFGYIQLFSDTVFTSLLVFYTGSSQSVFTLVYFFPVVSGAFMFFRVGALLFASFSTLMLLVILVLEFYGYPPHAIRSQTGPADFSILMQFFTTHALTFFLVAILSSLLAQRLKKAEAALIQTSSNYDRLAQLYKQIFDDIGTGIITVDDNSRITSFNRASELITGYRANEVLGLMIDDLFPGLKPVGLLDIRPVIDLARKNGDHIPVGYSWARLNTPDGCGNCRVYTMQDLSQIKKMEAQVQQAEKMAAIGQMAAGIAHEFRNPLAAISGAAQLLGQDTSDGTYSVPLMNIITRESDRLDNVIREFLFFSKPATPDKKWFPLKALCLESLEIINQSLGNDPKYDFQVKVPENLECWADPRQIKQILLNLITNSCNAMKGSGGRVTIQGEREGNETGNLGRTTVQISDTGPGIADNLLPNIFQPFFTTRKDGTGLGLAIVHQIITSHGGTIQVDSPPSGAVFRFSLPLP